MAAGVPPQTLLEEVTALPQTPICEGLGARDLWWHHLGSANTPAPNPKFLALNASVSVQNASNKIISGLGFARDPAEEG